MAKFQGTESNDVLPGLLGILAGLGDDQVYGLAGNDTLIGYSGNDFLEGGAGADNLIGGVLNVVVNVGKISVSGIDTASYETSTGGVTVNLDVVSKVDVEILGIKIALTEATVGSGGDAEGDILTGITNLTGSLHNDTLIGNDDANILIGLGGADALQGGAGADTLEGGGGDDVLDGGAGVDKLIGAGGRDSASYSSATAAVTVSLVNSAINTGDAAGDTFDSVESLIGSGHSDFLFGNNSNNTINGSAGSDTIKGYAGNDILIGGTGADIFVFNSTLRATTNVDKIMDFSSADDTMQIDDACFAGLTRGALADGAFKDLAVGTKDADDRILYNSDSGNLYFDRDGSGTEYGNIKFASLSGAPILTAADFAVI